LTTAGEIRILRAREANLIELFAVSGNKESFMDEILFLHNTLKNLKTHKKNRLEVHTETYHHTISKILK
jgi:hypothetical protein